MVAIVDCIHTLVCRETETNTVNMFTVTTAEVVALNSITKKEY